MERTNSCPAELSEPEGMKRERGGERNSEKKEKVKNQRHRKHTHTHAWEKTHQLKEINCIVFQLWCWCQQGNSSPFPGCDLTGAEKVEPVTSHELGHVA